MNKECMGDQLGATPWVNIVTQRASMNYEDCTTRRHSSTTAQHDRAASWKFITKRQCVTMTQLVRLHMIMLFAHLKDSLWETSLLWQLLEVFGIGIVIYREIRFHCAQLMMFKRCSHTFCTWRSTATHTVAVAKAQIHIISVQICEEREKKKRKIK